MTVLVMLNTSGSMLRNANCNYRDTVIYSECYIIVDEIMPKRSN